MITSILNRLLPSREDAVVPTHDEELATQWAERVASGQFSAGVVGLGSVRFMGKSGDEPVQFPRITSLAALDQLAPDEQWALNQVTTIVQTKQQRERRVLATMSPGTGFGSIVTRFDPTIADDYILLAAQQGG